MAAVSLSNSENHFDYAIVGGGCLGTSTVLALKRAWPGARIIWFEGIHANTASRDTSKIVRAAYVDEDYVAFAGKSLEMWQTVDPYRQFYHHTGWVSVFGESSQANIVKGVKDKMISVDEMRKRVGSREEPNLAAGEKLRLNENIGYIDCDMALEAVAKEAQGVVRIKKDVTKLMVEEGVCFGVEAGDDRVTADSTIVAAGPWTPGLLERSQVVFPQDFFTVAGVGVATMSLTEDEFDELKEMPILVTGGGEIILSKKHRVLKITTTKTFRIKHPDELTDGTFIDIGPNRALLEKMLPQFVGRELSSWICPDLMTPYQHPLVDQVPGTRQLYIVAGGSYHSAKFLPTIGGMLTRRLRGQTGSDTVEGRLLKRWTWDRSEEKVAIHRSVIPRDN